jgi:hypothetical protein
MGRWRQRAVKFVYLDRNAQLFGTLRQQFRASYCNKLARKILLSELDAKIGAYASGFAGC